MVMTKTKIMSIVRGGRYFLSFMKKTIPKQNSRRKKKDLKKKQVSFRARFRLHPSWAHDLEVFYDIILVGSSLNLRLEFKL